MLDQSLLQSNFIGRDGFRWWIGQIPPIESMGEQLTGGGWGNRFKVRILGYHPYSEADLPNEDLPWAQCLIPTTAGSGAANVATGVQLQPGDVVLGFFLDGDNAQIPVILATFGRTSSVPSTTYESPFIPFTGFSSLVPKNGGTNTNETNEVTQSSLPTPPDVSVEQGKQLSSIFGYQVISANSAIGDIIPLANTAQNAKTSKIKSVVTNLIKRVKRFQGNAQKITNEIRKAVDKIVLLSNEFVGLFMNPLIKLLKTLLNQGLKLLYKLVFATVLAATGNPIIAHAAGVAAQKAMVGPVKALEDSFSCVAGEVIDKLKNIVTNIITSAVENIDRFVSCVEDQFVGSLLNSIIDNLETLMSSPLTGVAKLLQFFSDFSVGKTMRSVVDGLGVSGAAFDCKQNFSNYQGLANEWVVGGGPKYGNVNPYNNVKNLVDIENSGVDPNSVVECFSGALQFANPPIINIFGGTGSNATAVPIFGNVVTGPDGNVTGSVIGVQITNPGSGYTFPPFIEIVDDNEQGYGAVGRSLINENGELESIYMVSEGENYSVGDISEYSVFDVIVEDGGSGYVDGDIVIDDVGNEYTTQIIDGSIYQVKPLNNVIQTLPILTVDTRFSGVSGSNAGSGAILRPLLGTPTFTGEIQTVVQCPK
jgi:hypothetical protein